MKHETVILSLFSNRDHVRAYVTLTYLISHDNVGSMMINLKYNNIQVAYSGIILLQVYLITSYFVNLKMMRGQVVAASNVFDWANQYLTNDTHVGTVINNGLVRDITQ